MKLDARSLFIALALSTVAPGVAAQALFRVSGGTDHTCAVSSTGGAYCWGANSRGQLGDGTFTRRLVPAPVAGLASGVVSIVAGQSHSCALLSSGGVKCWGAGGSVGSGAATDQATPVDVQGLTTGAVAIATHYSNSCAVTSAGTVRCWGDGPLGNGSTGGSSTPVAVSGITSGASAVEVGAFHACAIVSGQVRCWGTGSQGQLGNGSTASQATPVTLPSSAFGTAGVAVTGISLGEEYSCAVTNQGSMRCWGKNADGQLGDGTFTNRSVPTPVLGANDGVAMATGARHTCAIRAGNLLSCWGYNGFGNLGLGTTGPSVATPTNVASLNNVLVMAIGAGADHTCAWLGNTGLNCWGYGLEGAIGDNAQLSRSSPALVVGFAGSTGTTVQIIPVGRVWVGEYHACAISQTGVVSCWGANNVNQVGNGSSIDSSVPVQVANGAGFVAVGASHNCLLTSSGSVQCWGSNAYGQLGDGTRTNRSVPTAASGFSGAFTQLRAGGFHTCGIALSGGGVRCAGRNDHGQLGNGTFSDSNTSVAVSGLAGATDIRLGFTHTCAITSAGGVACWGDNRYGQLGDGTTTDRATPVPVSGLASGVTAISLGGYHSCALRTDGSVTCWGRNDVGQLGDGTTTQSPVPVAAAGLGTGNQYLAGGGFHTCVRTSGSAAVCWGNNLTGQLGDGTFTNRSAGVAVADLTASVVAINAGIYATCAVVADGGVRCWGDNSRGELGIGNLASKPTPQAVVGPGGAAALDLTPADGVTVPPTVAPTINLVVTGSTSGPIANVSASLTIRPQDAATPQNIYVYALAPASLVPGAKRASTETAHMFAKSAVDAKDTPIGCVIAQISQTGQLKQVDPSLLGALTSTIANQQTAAINVLNGVATSTIGGVTFFVGYGTSPSAMFQNGTTRSAASVVGGVQCQPQAPQKGWWWNAAEAGRGFSVEVAGDRIFFAAFLYDEDGRANWYVATGKTILDGSSYTGPLYRVQNGQTLAGPYVKPNPAQEIGTIALTFNTGTQGTIVWPGGVVPITRFEIVPRGLSAPPQANVPESGWWWNPDESGRGFFIEFQNGSVDVAGYMYDATGKPIWYLSVFETPNPNFLTGQWWQFANGQTLTGPYKPTFSRINDNVAPLSIRFDSPTTATMILPGGTTKLVRHRF